MSKVRSVTRANAARQSQYKKAQKSNRNSSPENRRGRSQFRRDQPPRRRCRGCGRYSHGEGKKPLSRDNCPAKGKKCDNCGKQDHFKKVCEQRSQASYVRGEDDTGSDSGSCSEDDYSCNEDSSIDEKTIGTHYAVRAKESDFRHCRQSKFDD